MKRLASAAERNRDPILEVLRGVFPREGLVLEIASGSGHHASYFARALAPLEWQPTDADPEALTSIAAHRDEARLPNLRAPLALDVTAEDWPVTFAHAVLCINMLHIAPWCAAEGLFRGAGRVLPGHGVLCTYGPYRFGATHHAPSNAAFDDELRERNPAFGVRDAHELAHLAEQHGLALEAALPRPANNHVLVFRPKPR